MAELLAVDDTANVSSSDFTIAAGAKAQISLKAAVTGPVPYDVRVHIERKDSDNTYTAFEELGRAFAGCSITNSGEGAMVCRVTRVTGLVGVDKG